MLLTLIQIKPDHICENRYGKPAQFYYDLRKPDNPNDPKPKIDQGYLAKSRGIL